jgi:predicted AAA+ superfamily ATPase
MEDLENEKFKDYKVFYDYVKDFDYIFVDEVQNIV